MEALQPILLCTVLVFKFLHASQQFQITSMKRLSESSYGATGQGDPWPEASLLSCVRTCSRKIDSCRSVTYSPSTAMCTSRSFPTFGMSSENADGDLFLYKDNCNSSLGFRLVVYRSVIQCFFVSTHKLVYQSARNECIAKGSHLYTAKTQDKLDLFLLQAQHIIHDVTHLGLTDQIDEGKFIWDDGEPLEDAWGKVLWKNRLPDNMNNNEDCAESSPQWPDGQVNDQPCWVPSYYICELDA